MLILLLIYGALLGYYFFRPQIDDWKRRFLAVERAVVPELSR